jgi:hypothetical protein
MTVTKYNSFKEIDERLKVLKLQKEITGEQFKLDVHKFKNTIHPANLKSGFSGFMQITLLSFVTKTLIRVLRKYRPAI